MQFCGFYALELAQSSIDTGDVQGAVRLTQEDLICSRSFKVIRSAGRLILLDILPKLPRIVLTKSSGKHG